MEMINMPVVEYLKTCKRAAYRRGFVWVMVLLARELDAVNSYSQLKHYWDSFDDLTGDRILFIMSIVNRKEESHNSHPAHENNYGWRIYNPNLLIMNQSIPNIPEQEFPSQKNIQKYRNIAIENNTHFISELCSEFNISEKDVPSIVLFRTGPFVESVPIVIPIKSDNLYLAIKDFIAEIEPQLKNHRKCKTELRNVELELEKLNSSIQQNVFSKPERRYIIATRELSHVIENSSTEIDIPMLKDAIERMDIHACKRFPQPIRGYLNQIIDLQKEYEGIESNIARKKFFEEQFEQQLYVKRSELEITQSKNHNMLGKACYDLDSAIKEYVSKLQKEGKKDMKIRVPHFKIGITFSGKYRKDFVKPICDALLNLGYTKDDIFYDSWHDALINGVHGDSILRQIYFKNCDCVVVLLSPDYKEKNWTGHIEWSAVKELINTGNDEKICLLKVDLADIGEIDGLYQNQAIAKAIDGISALEVAAFIDSKYKILCN